MKRNRAGKLAVCGFGGIAGRDIGLRFVLDRHALRQESAEMMI
jgi:hypothetical protein